MKDWVQNERALLACIIIDDNRKLVERAIEAQTLPGTFGVDAHGAIFSAILTLYESGSESFDEVVLGEQLRQDGVSKDIPDIDSELISITNSIETSAHFHYFLDRHRQYYLTRQLLHFSLHLQHCVEDGSTDVDEVIIDSVGRLEALQTAMPANGTPDLPFGDVKAVLDSGLMPERPVIGRIEGADGFLFYRGRINEIHGEPGIGKTNVSLAVMARLVNANRYAMFIDPEDSLVSAVSRMISFGALPEKLEKYFLYLHDPDVNKLLAAAKFAQQQPVAMVAIDGIAELLAAAGMSENDPGEILTFFRKYICPFADSNAAVVISDHVAKDAESRGRWARGSGAKLGRYDGAVYEIKQGVPYGPNKAGHVKLQLCKDRNGGVGHVGMYVAEIHFIPACDNDDENEDGIRPINVKITRGTPREEWKPTAIMDKIVEYLRAYPDAGTRDLRKLGKREYVDRGIEALQEEGRLEVIVGGPGKANKYVLKEIQQQQEERYGES